MLARPDGTTVFSVGEVPGHQSASSFTVVRLLANGAPDPAFNATGISTVSLGTPVTGDGLGASALNIGPSGTFLVAGTTATGVDGVLHPDDAYGHTHAAFTIALDALAAIGLGPERVVRTRMYVVAMNDQPAVGRAHRELFGAHPPAATMVQVGCLAHPEHLVEVEVEAPPAAAAR